MPLQSLIGQAALSLIPLGICSVLVIAVIFERIWAYARIGKAPKELMRRIESLVASGEVYEAVRLLDDYDSPYARVAKATLMRKDASLQEITDILTLACDAELAAAGKPLPVLGTIGNIAPFIGLFGTVFGIIHAFSAFSKDGTASAAVVQGVAEALIATAVGLGVGIVAVVANNWCNAWVEQYRLELERFATDWSYRLHALRQPAQEDAEPVA